VKAPGVSTTGRAKLPRAVGRRLPTAPSETSSDEPSFALSPALCAGFQRDLRSRPAYVGRAGSRGRPRSVPPESATHRVATGRHPASRLSVRNSVVAVLPTPPRLLATELRIGPHGVRTRFGSGRQQIASSRRSE
jgi:hypothetical protein